MFIQNLNQRTDLNGQEIRILRQGRHGRWIVAVVHDLDTEISIKNAAIRIGPPPLTTFEKMLAETDSDDEGNCFFLNAFFS
jgi:hypothetical protein